MAQCTAVKKSCLCPRVQYPFTVRVFPNNTIVHQIIEPLYCNTPVRIDQAPELFDVQCAMEFQVALNGQAHALVCLVGDFLQ